MCPRPAIMRADIACDEIKKQVHAKTEVVDDYLEKTATRPNDRNSAYNDTRHSKGKFALKSNVMITKIHIMIKGRITVPLVA